MPQIPSILLVGASIRWAAQSAASHCRVVGMDLFGDQDTIAACKRFRIISDAERSNAQKLAHAIAQFASTEHATTLRVGGMQHESTIQPEEAASLALAFGFRFPETLTSDDFLKTYGNRQPTNAPWLIKKVNSTGGLGIEVYRHCVNDMLPTNVYLQRRISGRPYGLVALATGNEVKLLGLTRSMHVRFGARPFVYAGSRTLSTNQTRRLLTTQEINAMQKLAEAVAHRRSLRGLFNLDFIQDRQNQWWLLEVNERPSASCEVIEREARATGRLGSNESLMTMHINSVLETDSFDQTSLFRSKFDNESTSAKSVHVKRIVYSRHDGRVHLSKLNPDWRTDLTAAVLSKQTTRIQTADRPAEGTPVQRGQPIATVLIDSTEERKTVALRLKHSVAEVQSCVITSPMDFEPKNFDL
ncbi:ATP-grasp domain-containing protein [Rhodopirellula sp. SWK7]|uniref:ATP-grasp domain-containing protein n=1 Tax=Rhodopirellula sp. SWK7 TaxID=595460 RepID=UPI0011818B36|nr:ATP-grasp domain-containing protein [Rhodopirellula sp. SWK7]